MSDHNTNPQHKLEAHLAIVATDSASAPEGEPPTQEELALLLEERFDFTRRKEVLSHLNTDHDLYAQWLQLVESAELLHETPHKAASGVWQRLRQWLHQPALQGAVAVLLLLVVAWPLFLNPPDEAGLAPGVEQSPQFASHADAMLERSIVVGARLAYRELEEEKVTSLPPAEPFSNASPPAGTSRGPLSPLGVQLGEAMVYTQQACSRQDSAGVMQLYNERLRPLLDATGLRLDGEMGSAAAICTSIDKALARRMVGR